MNWYRSSGVLEYGTGNAGLKLVLRIDQGIADFYRSLIPKYVRIQPQMYPAHISVVRKEPVIPAMEYWGIHEGEEVDFLYENVVRFGEVYCWLNVVSKRLEDIRLELGLPVSSPYTLPPDGYGKIFHTTIGNRKHML